MKLDFSPALYEDIEPLFRLNKDLIDRYEDTKHIDYDSVLKWVRNKLETHIDEYRRILWEGRYVGYFHFSPSEGQMELDDLYIFPEFQGQGIGTALLRRLTAESELPIFLYVFVKNRGACALYQRLGFTVAETVGDTRYRMVWRGFNRGVLHGFLLKGKLRNAMEYLKQFPAQEDLYQKYVSVFEQEHYPHYEEDAFVDAMLLIYQRYYREIFYLGEDAESAKVRMGERFADLLGVAGDYEDLETGAIAEAFRSRSFFFLGGRTGGYFGPYIWKETEERTYDVELPEGRQEYPVQILDGFISRSWLAALSFGEIGTGGWSNGDGIICCVKSAYDFESESFQVSLLKHEAQHALDLARYPDMTSEELEYRAKLVELIYSKERNLLRDFRLEANPSGSGHSLAASRIIQGFPQNPETLSTQEIQRIARELFDRSCQEYR